ncbi:MAG: hypothetical protein HOP08_12670 [Cyclobacteriaceae bacterium]|nr:hypothetical protein [Cyclobacteriaceae bacterium]
MKHLTFLLILPLLWVSISCRKSSASGNKNISAILVSSESSNKCINQSDAESILGENAKLTENISEKKDGISEYKCTYTASSKDAKSNRIGVLFYMLEEFKDTVSAHKKFTEIISINNGMAGQEKIDVGADEGWLHSDAENFHLIMFRVGKKIARLKVNKVTNLTSMENLKAVAGRVALEMKE